MDGTPTTETGKLTKTARALTGFRKGTLALRHTRKLAEVLFGEDVHAKRVESLANGVAGVLNAAMLSVHAIGQAYAAMAHIQPRSGVKQLTACSATLVSISRFCFQRGSASWSGCARRSSLRSTGRSSTTTIT